MLKLRGKVKGALVAVDFRLVLTSPARAGLFIAEVKN